MKKNLFVLVVVLMSVMVGCGSKPTLSRWLDSDDVATVEEQINTAYAEANLGLRAKFSADSEDFFVFSYIYEQYENLAGLNQSEIDATFAEESDSLDTSANMTSIFEECEKATEITLKYIRVQCVNADGTVIYSQDYVNTK